jgi:murein DD-endopeptidase MepM/ murein hydrolase activator NlpD
MTIPLGERRTRMTHSVLLTGRRPSVLPQGAYTLRISARDRRGRGLGRSARSIGARDLDFFHHRFPLVGAFSYGGADSRFGAPRRGHTHQGHDLSAADGTPIVAPRSGVIRVIEYQASGAGHYVVLRGDDERRDYVFMHLRAGSIPVRVGQRVRTGQRLGEVGTSGTSTGPHLHFEVWVGGWFERDGAPIDPYPLLRAWDSWS